MREQGFTQKALAEKAHISQSTLSAILNGTPPKESTVSALADALGLTINELKESKRTTQEISVCPRCGSTAIYEWIAHGSGKVRFRCGYCEADTGEQRSREHAISVFNSFQHSADSRQHANVYVLSLAELLDSAFADADDVRPVWFENRGLFVVPALVQYGAAERELELVKVLWFGSMAPKSYLLDLYGTAWRTWNSRPTAERCDAEPWKD